MKAIVITPSKLSVEDIDGYKAARKLVGGDVEQLLFGPGTLALVNLGLPRNDMATKLVRHFLAKLDRDLLPGDFIKGTMVVVGEDSEGDWSDLSQEQIDEISSVARQQGADATKFVHIPSPNPMGKVLK